MAHAEYRIHVPTLDRIGQRLHPHLPHAAHEWLRGSKPRLFESVWIEGPHQHAYGPAHHIVTVAEDSPETDSYVKQLASHVGEIANHPAVLATKQGKDGVQSWTVPNRHFVEGLGADPRYLSVPPLVP